MAVKISELTETQQQQGLKVAGSLGQTTYKYDLGNMPIFVSSIEEIKGQLSSYER